MIKTNQPPQNPGRFTWHTLDLRARELNPACWSGKTRNWTPIGVVKLNPERDAVIKTHLADNKRKALAA
jgi:putative transposase